MHLLLLSIHLLCLCQRLTKMRTFSKWTKTTILCFRNHKRRHLVALSHSRVSTLSVTTAAPWAPRPLARITDSKTKIRITKEEILSMEPFLPRLSFLELFRIFQLHQLVDWIAQTALITTKKMMISALFLTRVIIILSPLPRCTWLLIWALHNAISLSLMKWINLFFIIAIQLATTIIIQI